MASLPAPPLMKSLPFEPMMLLAPALAGDRHGTAGAPGSEVLEVDLRKGISHAADRDHLVGR